MLIILSLPRYLCGPSAWVPGRTDRLVYLPMYGCPPGQSGTCCYICRSPIIIDVANDGFDLTKIVSGVWFPIGPSSFMYNVAWTYPYFR
jgi:hypothetical protein